MRQRWPRWIRTCCYLAGWELWREMPNCRRTPATRRRTGARDACRDCYSPERDRAITILAHGMDILILQLRRLLPLVTRLLDGLRQRGTAVQLVTHEQLGGHAIGALE